METIILCTKKANGRMK